MNIVSKEELKNVYGGGLGKSFIIGLVAAGAFIIGFLDGYNRPYACRK